MDVYEREAARLGIKPNITHQTYATPGLASAALVVVPDTSDQVVMEIGVMLGLHVVGAGVARSTTWMYNRARNTAVVARGVPRVSGAKELNNTVKLTKERLSDYLKNIENIPKEKLISDLEQINIIAKSREPREFVEFVHVKNWRLMTKEEMRIAIRESPVQFKIHPPDKRTPYHHVHAYDKLGNSLDASLNKVNKNSPEAHIKIEEFVKVFMENKL